MSVAEPSGSSPSPLPIAIEKPEADRPRASRGIVVDPRVMFVGGAVALIGVAVFALFLWMVPNAAAHEAQAACHTVTLRDPPRGPDHQPLLAPDGEPLLSPALCPGGGQCTAPVPAPDFTAQDVTGKMVKLSDFRGKVVLLNFWASWCGVCKAEKPQLNAMAAEMANRDDFVVLALASDHNWADALSAVLDSLAPEAAASLPKNPTMAQVGAAFRQALPDGTPFKVLLDPPNGDENIGKIAASWGIKAVPETALIDRQGNIRAYFVNKRDWSLPVTETCLRSVIDGP
jgi:thiol-disulfide isomerase/thioredoxin